MSHVDSNENVVPDWARPRLRVAIYCRISTDELHQPFSLEAQQLKLGSYIHSQDNWELTLVFIDQASGATTDREDLNRALAAAKAGKFDVLLVYRVDRLSRSVRGLSDIIAKLDDAGVVFRSATEPFDTATPAGRMMVQMLAVFAEFERATIIDQVVNGMERKAARGEWCGGYRPHGYELNSDTGYLVVVATEEAVVKRIFHLYTHDNVGAKAIANDLNASGHRTKAGKPWSGNAVLVVLRNRVYLGEVFFRDRWYRGEKQQHKAIIDHALFEEADQILIARGEDAAQHARSASVYALAGLIICTHCGKRFLGTAANGNRYRYRYYTCYTRHRYGIEACAAERLPADQIEEGVLTSLLDTLYRTDLIDAALASAHAEAAVNQDQHTDEIIAIEIQLTKINEKTDRSLIAFENKTMAEDVCGPRLAALADEARQLRRRKDELQLSVDSVADTPSTPDPEILAALRGSVREALDRNKPGLARQVIVGLTEEIRVTDRNHVKPTFRIPTAGSRAGLGAKLKASSAATVGKVRPLTRTVPPGWPTEHPRQYLTCENVHR